MSESFLSSLCQCFTVASKPAPTVTDGEFVKRQRIIEKGPLNSPPQKPESTPIVTSESQVNGIGNNPQHSEEKTLNLGLVLVPTYPFLPSLVQSDSLDSRGGDARSTPLTPNISIYERTPSCTPFGTPIGTPDFGHYSKASYYNSGSTPSPPSANLQGGNYLEVPTIRHLLRMDALEQPNALLQSDRVVVLQGTPAGTAQYLWAREPNGSEAPVCSKSLEPENPVRKTGHVIEKEPIPMFNNRIRTPYAWEVILPSNAKQLKA